LILAAFFVAASFTSCEEEKVEPNGGEESNPATRYFSDLMDAWYYWYQEIPDVDPANFDSPEALLEEIRYEEDRWSYITSYEAFQQYYDEGAYTGYGFGSKWDDTDTLRVTFVFEDSPLQQENISRGWAITHVNGDPVTTDENINELLGANEVGVTNEFTFVSPGAKDTVEASFDKKEVAMNTVLMDTVINRNNTKIGYFVLKSFIGKTPDELTETFRTFASEGIDELVIDLRYNGGGTLSASRFLGEFVIPEGDVGSEYVSITHNDKRAENHDTTHVFQEDSLGVSLGLSRAYFITTQSTASASEALINGLEPYMDVYLVGQDTYGKPVGMYAFTDDANQYAFVPVSFSLMNAEGVADYFDGLPVDGSAADGIRYPFASGQEASFQQVLHHIENGSFDVTKAAYPVRPVNRVDYNSLRDEIGAH
jgi:hypothetical protein